MTDQIHNQVTKKINQILDSIRSLKTAELEELLTIDGGLKEALYYLYCGKRFHMHITIFAGEKLEKSKKLHNEFVAMRGKQ
ncbi:MAG: hypothetical protein INF44_02655 [Thalassospira sp.]|jgi:hypothetical protein|nr:hypothetical protein [Thalassospira sp.]